MFLGNNRYLGKDEKPEECFKERGGIMRSLRYSLVV